MESFLIRGQAAMVPPIGTWRLAFANGPISERRSSSSLGRFPPLFSSAGNRPFPNDQASVFRWVVDGDPFCLRLRSLGLRQNDLENAVLKRGLDLVFVDVNPDRNLPFEAAVETFAELALFVLRLGFHFAAKDQIAVVQENLDVFFLHAGNFRRDRNLLFAFGDFELRPGGIHEIHPAPGKRSRGEAAKGIFKKAVISRCNVRNGLDVSSRKKSGTRSCLRLQGMRSRMFMAYSPKV